ncbi:MAG: hypothetical protein R2880_07070 [Deinococcales bacterium]
MSGFLTLIFLFNLGYAQPMYLPPSEYGKAQVVIPEAQIIRRENVFGQAPAFEPILDFPVGSLYWQIAQAVGRLDMLIEQGDKRFSIFCTATLIAKDMAITSYHCLPGYDPSMKVVGAQLRMDYLSGRLNGEPFEVGLEPLEQNQDLDYTILKVYGDPGLKYGILPLKVREPVEGEKLFMIHHPRGNPKQLTRGNCELYPAFWR